MLPLKIEARGLGKRFTRDWIVRGVDHVFTAGSRTAIVGPNGSGKSTLLKLLSGQLLPSEGEVGFHESGHAIESEDIWQRVSLTGPYLELIEELSGEESIDLHYRLRGFRQNLTPAQVWERVVWTNAIRRQRVSSYSSGMKQRLRLLLALGTKAGAIFLDEPTSNLDGEGVDWYHRLLDDWTDGRTLLIASNEERDFAADSERILAKAWQPETKRRRGL